MILSNVSAAPWRSTFLIMLCYSLFSILYIILPRRSTLFCRAWFSITSRFLISFRSGFGLVWVVWWWQRISVCQGFGVVLNNFWHRSLDVRNVQKCPKCLENRAKCYKFFSIESFDNPLTYINLLLILSILLCNTAWFKKFINFPSKESYENTSFSNFVVLHTPQNPQN